MDSIVGIDFGSKLAGTTVIAYYRNEIVRFMASKHQEDADKFIIKYMGTLKPVHVFLDAPLSLPGKYQNSDEYSDYFYRQADRELGAMSPMFIGGLTARAIRLKDYLASTGIEVYETYPSKQAEIIDLDMKKYKKDEKHIMELSTYVADKFDLNVSLDQMATWHHFDALLAYVAGLKFLNKTHQTVGNSEEGLILL